MTNLPAYISVLFGLTVLITIAWFYYVSKSNKFLIIASFWTVLQSIIGLNGVYQDTDTMPPKLMVFGILPSLILILTVFFTKKGKVFINQLNIKKLTYFHGVRIAVEILLGLLFYYGVVSIYMTLEGTNFDLFSGITAPIVAYLAFKKGKENRNMLLFWNSICLLLLINVVVTAIFAFPSPFQKLSFEQPNIAILYFPFNLLPTVVVPIVLFSHLAAIKRLATKNKL